MAGRTGDVALSRALCYLRVRSGEGPKEYRRKMQIDWKDGLPPDEARDVYLGKDAGGAPFLLTWYRENGLSCWGALGFEFGASGERRPILHLLNGEKEADYIVAHAVVVGPNASTGFSAQDCPAAILDRCAPQKR